MPTEDEKRLHRCCFSGHRLEKLEEPEEQIKVWLETQIRAAIASGFTTFISGCAMGVDIWAGQIVIRLRDEEKVKKGNSSLRLIAATPWPGFSNRWNIDWQEQYSHLLRDADLVVPVSNRYSKDGFQKRNEWMVDHSARVIAYYNGAPGGTRDAIEYAEKKGVEVITNNPDYKPKERKQKKAVAEKLAYRNILESGAWLLSGGCAEGQGRSTNNEEPCAEHDVSDESDCRRAGKIRTAGS